MEQSLLYLNFNVGLSDDSDEKHNYIQYSKRAIAEKAAITVGMTAESA